MRDGRTGGRADGRTGGRADGRTGGRADGRTGGRADGRTRDLATDLELREIIAIMIRGASDLAIPASIDRVIDQRLRIHVQLRERISLPALELELEVQVA